MSAWKTKRTSGLSTPMPKAIVAHMTTPSSCRKASWLCERTACVEAGVIGQRAPPARGEFLRQLLGAPARGAIDDAALAAVRFEPSRRAGASRCPSAASPETGSAGRTSARTRAGARRNSRSTMSSRVGASAVAVTAIVCDAAERLGRLAQAHDIRGGSRGPIARRNGPRRWRGGRRAPASAPPSVSSRTAARARHRAGAASARASRARCAGARQASEAELSAAAATPSSRSWAT